MKRCIPILVLFVLACAPGASFSQVAPAKKVNPVPQLLKNLDSLDEHTSANAARSLGIVFKSKDTSRDQLQAAVDQLIEKMNTSKWTRVRLECIKALGEIKAQKAVDPLKEVVRNENTSIATGAGGALAQILHVDAARALFKKMGEDPAEHVQRVAYGAMIGLATQDDVEFLVKGIDSPNWRIQVDALRGLERATSAGARLDGEVYDLVTSKLGNEIANVADAAINVLTRVRSSESMRALMVAADTPDDGSANDVSWRIRANALRAFHRIGFPANQSALPSVIRRLDDRTGNVIREAKAILQQVRSNANYFRSTPEQVGPIAAKYLYPRFLAELEKAESLSLRSKIIDEMGTGGVTHVYAARVAEVAARSLDDALAANATSLRNQSLQLLGSSGATGVDSALSTSLAALKTSLEKHGDKTTADPTFRIRSRALQAVSAIGYPRNRPILPEVIRQLDDETSNVFNEAHNILHRVRHNHRDVDTFVGLMLAELKAVENDRLKAKILREMGSEIPTRHASEVARIASEALADATGKPEMWEMRTGAVTVLGGTGTTGDIELIAQCVGDDEPTARKAAGEALIKLSEVCEPTEVAKTISTLLPLIDKSVDWRKASIAARALGSYPTADAVDALIRMTGHSVINVKENSSYALAKFAKGADPELRSAVETGLLAAMKTDPAKWEYGANVLGALQSEAALPQLRTMLAEGDWRTQVNAIHAVLAVNSKDPVKDKLVSDAIIKCTLSKVRQVHESANQALRALTPEE